MNDEEDEERAGEEEGQDEAPEQLGPQLMKEKLSLLCKVGSGLSHAFVRADLQGLSLGDITLLSCFAHIRYLDISNNKVSDITCLGSLGHLVVLKADHNLLQSVQLPPLTYLQVANFAHNKLTSTSGIAHPLLENLDLSFNQITELTDLTADNLPTLATLDCHGNALTSARNINVPTLRKLYLASNQIKTLEGLAHLHQLTTLHMRENQLSLLSGLTDELVALQYINLRNNPLEDITEVAKLSVLPFLRALVLTECSVTETDEYRLEVLIAVRTLERLDKEAYENEERQDAEEMASQRRPIEADKEVEDD